MQPALPPQALQVADAVTVRGLRGAPLQAFTTVSGGSGLSGSGPGTLSPSPSPQPPESHTPTQDETPIICRLAERVRLKRVSENHYIASVIRTYLELFSSIYIRSYA